MEHNRVEKIGEFDRPSGQTFVHMPTIQKIVQEKQQCESEQNEW